MNSEEKRLREVRKHLKLTQEEFAELLGVEQGSLSPVERGKVGISSKLLKALVQKVGIDAHWLMTGEGSMFIGSRNNPDVQEVHPEEKKQDSMTLIEFLRRENEFLKSNLDRALRMLEVKLGKIKVCSLTAFAARSKSGFLSKWDTNLKNFAYGQQIRIHLLAF